MCGRFSLAVDSVRLIERFALEPPSVAIEPRYNIAPGQHAPVVVSDGRRYLQMMRWGLVPSWSKDERVGYRMINARAETLLERPSFREPFLKQRCLVPADGFYEWTGGRGKKDRYPVRVVMKSGEPFAMAGLWDTWKSNSGEFITTFTIVTTEPNQLIGSIHHRMPVIIAHDDEGVWIDSSERNAERLLSLLKPYDSDEMDMYRVSSLVNFPKNDSPECIVRRSDTGE